MRDLTRDFHRLVDATKRTFNTAPAPQPVAAPPLPAPSRALVFHDWASEPEGAEMAKWLAEEVETAHANANRLVGTAQGAWWLGYEAALRTIRAEIQDWRGQPAGTPPARPA